MQPDPLTEADRVLADAADGLAQIAFVASAEGDLLHANPAAYAYTGLDPERARVAARALAGSIHPEDLPAARRRWLAARSAKEPFEAACRLRRSTDAAWRWHVVRARPIGGDARPLRWFGTATDAEDQRQLEAQRAELQARAERESQARDGFLASVAHELRTPLQSILGWTYVLRRAGADPATVTRAVDTIERNAHTQMRLVSRLHDASRMVSGQLQIAREPVDMRRVVQAAVDAARPAAEAGQLELRAALDPRAGQLSGDAERLRQIVDDLLSNAIRYTPPGGRVEVRLNRFRNHVELQVVDSGQGIPPERLPHIFERFHQTEAAGPAETGLGLGLAIVRHLTELHGGTVHAESAGVGQGASFTVTLPIPAVMAARPQAQTAERDASCQASAEDLRGVRVLVVDDEPDALALLLVLVESRGAEAKGTRSSTEALALLGSWRPDVIVSDIGMRGEDGYTFMRRIRELPASAGGEVPAVALTAFARLEDRNRALLAGFQRHVAKPVDPGELVGILCELAAERRGKSA